MELSDIWDGWCFMLQLETGEMIPVDLTTEEDWGDIEPVLDSETHRLSCTLGKLDGSNDRKVDIVRVWRREDKRFNGKFTQFADVTLGEFVRALFDAGDEFHGQSDAASLKKEYGL